MWRNMIGLWIAAVLLVGCNGSREEVDPDAMLPPDIDVVDETETQDSSLPDDAPSLQFTVKQLHERLSGEGDSNQIRADFSADAQGHWIDLTGVVHAFKQEGGTGAPGAYVTLREADPSEETRIPKQVDVIMATLDEAWGKLTPGDEATLRSQWSEWSGFHNGKVIAGGGEPIPQTTAAELVAAIKADKQAAIEKYHDKYWIVTGPMADKQPYKDGFSFGFDDVYFSAVMKGDDDTNIALELPHVLVIHRLEPQEEVEILGKLKILDEEEVTEQKPYYIGIVDGSRIDVDSR